MFKKSIIILVFFGLLLMPCGFNLNGLDSRAETAYNEYPAKLITVDTVWHKADGPYVLCSDVVINTNAALTIEPGTIIKMGQTGIRVKGRLIASGTPEEPVIFTSIYDDEAGEDNSTWSNQAPQAGDWSSIKVESGGEATLDHCRIRYGGQQEVFMIGKNNFWSVNRALAFSYNAGALLVDKGVLSASRVLLANNIIGLEYYDGSASIVNSEIYDNQEYGVLNSGGQGQVLAVNNWWGDDSGPARLDCPDCLGDRIGGDVVFEPFTRHTSSHSSVIFIPGIKASRLYQEGTFFENQLWEPNRQADVEKLMLDADGQSRESGIYTRDAIDEVNLVNIFGSGANIYKSFLSGLDDLAEEGLINEAAVFPYDWRQGIDEIVSRPVRLEEGGYSMIDRALELADASQTKKISIVAHSMGGLVAKELINSLTEQGQADIVDKLILVASPQSGTPDAVGALLHGDGQDLPENLGILLDKPIARSFGQYMQSAYALLPSARYLEDTSQPVIEFAPNAEFLSDLRDRYGQTITDIDKLSAFLSGQDWRLPPNKDDTDTPAILSEQMLNRAHELHDNWDNWIPPSSLQVIQIAGWGLDTVSGIKYKEKKVLVCPNNNYDGGANCEYQSTYAHVPIFSIAGDATVITDSADMMEGVESYYVDLESLSHGIQNTDRNHSNILEINSLKSIIGEILKDNDIILPDFIYSDRNELLLNNPRLRISVHSPILFNLYNNDLHTGRKINPDPESDLILFEEQVPGSYYREFGNSKYIGVKAGLEYRLELQGIGVGTFDLEVSQISGSQGENEETVFYKDIPVTPQTLGSISFSDLENLGNLEIDIDGNGQADLYLNQENTVVDPLDYLSGIRSYIKDLDIKLGTRIWLLLKLRAIKGALAKDWDRTANVLIRFFEYQLNRMPDKRLETEKASILQQMLSALQGLMI